MATRSFESVVQNLVYNVDEGGGFRVFKVLLYILLVLVLMLVYTASQFDSLTEAEAMEYAQLGRNLAQEGKLVTQVVRPGTMTYLMQHSAEGAPRISDHPDIVHPPLYPALLALVFKITGVSFETQLTSLTHAPEQWVVLPLGHLFTLLTGLFVWLIGRRLFDNRVGLLAMTVFFLSDSVWRTSISGLDLSLATFLVTGALYAALVTVARRREQEDGARPGGGLVPFIVSIVLCILAFLTRYSTVVIVPAVALFYALQIRPHGWKWGTVVLVAFIIGIAPWMMRNKAVSGGFFGYAPTTVLEDTRLFPGDQLDRRFQAEEGEPEAFKTIVRSLQIKWLENTRTFYNGNLRTMGEGLVVCFFLVTFFYSFARAHTRWLRWCLCLAMILLLAAAGLFGPGTIRALHIFLPVVVIYGTAFFVILLDRMQFTYPVQRVAVGTVFVLLVAAPLAVALMPPKKGHPYPPYLPPYIAYSIGLTTTNELVCTDMPWATAWYGDRTSILLPRNLEEFYEINDDLQTVDALLFTLLSRDARFVSDLYNGPDKSWFPVQMGQLPEGFPKMEGMPLMEADMLLLARSQVLDRSRESADKE